MKHSTDIRDAPTLATDRPQRTDWLQVAAVFLLFFVYSALCRPVPSVNEPHYLTKARHVWQPGWCDTDFFLNSSSPHLVFYRTIGVLTDWLTLSQAAWAGRAIALLLLAWGWTRLVSRLSDARWIALGSAGWFLLLQSLGNLSGEWVVGGVESKVFAYALAFAGWASLIDARPVSAGICLGLAISFHPVVGGWCVIAAAMALGWEKCLGVLRERRWNHDRPSSEPSAPPHEVDSDGSRNAGERETQLTSHRDLRPWIAGGLLLLACALPGVVPAMQSLGGVDPQAAALADRYQVGTRLAHHLDPLTFPLTGYRYFGLLLVVWLLMQRPARPIPGRRLANRIMLASLVIAGAGFLIAWGPRPIQTMPLAGLRIWLLKFYPFRLADLIVPLLVAVSTYELLSRSAAQFVDDNRRNWAGGMLTVVAVVVALWLPHPDKNPSRMTERKRADWIAACEWIRTQTPADALVQAANEHWAVKWFCRRGEYVNYKDCPQDPAGILEWARRLKAFRRWQREALDDGTISSDELRQLHDETGITDLLVGRLGPIEDDPVYENGSFRIYAIGR